MTKLSHRFEFYLYPKAPYDFKLTVRKPAGWDLFTSFEIYEEDVLWTALHIDGLLVGLNLRSAGSTDQPVIQVDVFLENTPTPDQQSTIKERLAIKLSAHEDLGEFYQMAKKDSILKLTLDDLYGMHGTGFSHLFAAAILAISLQMAPTKRSNEMMECLINDYGELPEFDGKRIRVWPLPESIAHLGPSDLARQCKLGYRAKYIIQLARILQKGGFPSLEELRELSPEEAKEKLLELPGIGDYSADILNPHGGFPLDVWSADIFGKLFYGKEPKNMREAIGKIKADGLQRWGRWSWMAFLYVVHDLENLSRKLGISLRLY